MNHTAYAVTGATGFVGRALVLELLTTTDVDVVCLVRPSGRPGEGATRLFDALTDAARAYGYPDSVLAAIHRRCHLVPADLAEPLNATTRALCGGVEQIWHCAGSLRYHERDRRLITRTNVNGTARMLRLAAELGVTGFHYVSTAYVAGSADGVIREEPADPAAAQNAYETSKICAEDLVLSATALRTTVLRPSVVIGHSRTAAVSGNLSGIYGLALRLARYCGIRAGHDGIRLHVDPAATTNLVPVDQVAAEAVACGLAGRRREIFHLVGRTNVAIGEGLAQFRTELGLGPVTLVDSPADLRSSDRWLADRLSYYLSYMRGDKVFDRTNTDRVVGGTADRYAGRPALVDVWRWYATMFGNAGPLALAVGAR